MATRRSFFSWERTKRRTGGEHLLEHLRSMAGADPVAVHGDLTFSDDVAVVVYRYSEPVPHLLYVTHGLSRTHSSQPVAGIQDELSLRVPDAAEPPTWPVRRLHGLASFLRNSGDTLEPGHYMDLRSPVCTGANLSAFIFVNDPILEISAAPTGWVRFIYAVAVTADELETALRWDPLKFAGVLGDSIPLGLSDPRRAPLLIDAPTSSSINHDGSSISAVSSSYFSVDETGRIDLTTHAAAHLLRAMTWRLGYGRTFAVMGSGEGADAAAQAWARFLPAEEAGSPTVDATAPPVDRKSRDQPATSVTVTVNRALRHEILAVLDTAPGTYRMTTAPLTFHVIDPAR